MRQISGSTALRNWGRCVERETVSEVTKACMWIKKVKTVLKINVEETMIIDNNYSHFFF